MNNKTIAQLKVILASSHIFSLKLQNYHWNVTGPNFKPLHELFGEQYEELSDAIDEIAERIRAIGGVVEANVVEFSKLSKIKCGDHNLNATAMLKDLSESHKTMVSLLNEGIKIGQEEGDEASVDLLIGRIAAHEKALWMIDSSI